MGRVLESSMAMLAVAQPSHKFSKVSALVYSAYQATLDRTFENYCRETAPCQELVGRSRTPARASASTDVGLRYSVEHLLWRAVREVSKIGSRMPSANHTL